MRSSAHRMVCARGCESRPDQRAQAGWPQLGTYLEDGQSRQL